MKSTVTLSTSELIVEGEADELVKALEAMPNEDISGKLVLRSSIELAQCLKAAGFAVELAEPESEAPAREKRPKKERQPRITYTPEQIAEVKEWVAANRGDLGRKTVPAAAEKFGVSAALVRKWTKDAESR